MKKRKLLCLGMAVVMAAAVFLQGCGEKDLPVNEYKSDDGMYSLSLPGEWKTDDNMGVPGMVSLVRDDGISTLAIGMTKEQAGVATLEEYQSFIEESLLNGMFATSDIKKAEVVKMPEMKNSIATEATVTDAEGAKGSIFIEYMESDAAYYVLMLSSDNGKLKDLEPVKKKMALKELEVKVAGADTSDTVRWFNATYAILNKANGGNVNLAGGFEASDAIKETMVSILERDWEITDRATLDEQVNWLISEGHNKDALDYLSEQGAADGMTRDELIAAMESNVFTAEEKTVMLAAYDAKTDFGDNALKAWDQSRAMQLMGFGYLSGYCTYQEAMNKSLEIAGTIQTTYASWDEFIKSYFYGYEYWSGEDTETADSGANERLAIYEELKASENSPFSLDWNLAFVNDWQ